MSASMSSRVLNNLVWNLKPHEFPTLTEKLIGTYRALLDRIAATPETQRTFENVIKPLAEFEAESVITESILTFPLNVSDDAAVRDASTEAKKALEAFQIEAQMRSDVYEVIRDFSASPEASSLAPEDRRFVDFLVRDYRRNGLHLPAETRARHEALSKELAEMCTAYSQNVNNDATEEWMTPSELEGLPAGVLEALVSRGEDGKRQVTMKYPHIEPCLQYVKDAAVRARLDKAFKGRQLEANVPLAERILGLREERARLLGYESSAAYTLEIEMAKDPATVDRFYEALVPRLLEKGRAELQVLQGLKGGQQILSEDFRYFHTRLQESLGVDDEAIRQYFPLEHVLKEMLATYEALFSCRFLLVEGAEVWHKDVKMYAVSDAGQLAGDDGAFIGSFYLDLFPREGKFSHAAVFPLQMRSLGADGRLIAPCGSLVCNFSQPTADAPSLLKHSEVVTLLHEFGHQCHVLFSTAKYARMSGTNTERDFVECPSQMLEEWCYQPSVLKRLSRHHQSGEPLPDGVIQRLVELKNLNSGLLNLRQAFFGNLDQTLHRGPLGSKTTQQLWHELRSSITLIPEAPDTNPLSNFGHLFGGYDSRYYGYLWSEVYAAALFEKFADSGFDAHGHPNDPTLGARYRQEILAPGGSRDSSISLRCFLGHEPSVDPFMKSIGL